MNLKIIKLITAATIALLVLIVAPNARAQTQVFPVDVVWSTNTYVPSEFNIKPLPIGGSLVTVTALTPGQNPASLNFRWIVEDVSFLGRGPALSGAGENIYKFSANRYIPGFVHRIRVIVENTALGTSVEQEIEIPLAQPTVRFYDSSYAGAYVGNAVAAVQPGETTSIIARPFYFSVHDVSSLLFSWVFNNQPVSGTEKPDTLEFSLDQNTPRGIERSFSVSVENPNNNRERANNSGRLRIAPF